ncbi:MAG: 2-amino-4-hydroxy-6-hydroxymethyldihydropteridine diphosphokinase [Bacteroidetes bacterium]|nr:2-amino-4-hydroxy-6-hydroxymethyldihydropteridine diphosphokinase [Bacteroidota bacterium]
MYTYNWRTQYFYPMADNPNNVIVMLGGNSTNTRLIFMQAIDLLIQEDCEIRSKSSLYETAPWGIQNQSNFLNLAVWIKTSLNPFDLLDLILKIENLLGRVRTIKNGPRIIDIDILLFNQLIINEPALQIPHPRMHLRRFNLLPLNEIAPFWIHPVLNQEVSEILSNCTDSLEVKVQIS